METFAEAWQAASEKIMPGFIAKRCAVWAGADEKPLTPPTSAKPVKKAAWSSGLAVVARGGPWTRNVSSEAARPSAARRPVSRAASKLHSASCSTKECKRGRMHGRYI